MKTYIETVGDLISLAKEGNFDVIAHGVNCFSRQKSGLAPQMVETFGTNRFKKESMGESGDINKLGMIDYQLKIFAEDGVGLPLKKPITVVNCYTQYKIKQFSDVEYEYTTKDNPFDYEAFVLCCRKMNEIFKGKHIGLPQIGCGLAGGDWNTVRSIIQKELKDCQVTVVIYNK